MTARKNSRNLSVAKGQLKQRPRSQRDSWNTYRTRVGRPQPAEKHRIAAFDTSDLISSKQSTHVNSLLATLHLSSNYETLQRLSSLCATVYRPITTTFYFWFFLTGTFFHADYSRLSWVSHRSPLMLAGVRVCTVWIHFLSPKSTV